MTKIIFMALGTIGICGFGYRYFKSSAPQAGPAAPAAVTVTKQSDPAVELVRGGSLPGFTAMTVGKAFEDRFEKARWNSFQTPNGATMVDFSGVVRSDALSAAGLNVAGENPIIVRSNCIGTLGLKAKMEEEAQSAQASERAASQATGKEDLAEVKVRQKQKEAEKGLSDANEAKIEACIESVAVPVKFQFKVAADKKTFELVYIDHMPFGETAPGRVLTFVYQHGNAAAKL